MPTKRKTSPSTTSKPTTKPTTTMATTLPQPFTPAPPSSKPITDLLDPSKIYITHLDRLPIPQKQTIFLIPIFLNGLIALLLLWRLYHAIPTYWILILTLLGNKTAATVDVVHTTMSQQVWVLAKRVGVMTGDYLLFAYIGPWPVTFFAEQPANPCSWRWKVGFKEEEVVVRVSRGWGAEELLRGKKKGEESAFWKTRVGTAVGREVMSKTGYLMMGVDWDLDFEAMVYLEALVGRGEVKAGRVDRVVWGSVEGVGWGCWRFGEDGEGGTEEERRREVVRFKDVLTGMGKEGLFWKWTEIVEEERGGDGEFTVEGRERVESRVKEAFEKEGVDFEDVKRRVGGGEGKEGRVPMGLAV